MNGPAMDPGAFDPAAVENGAGDVKQATASAIHVATAEAQTHAARRTATPRAPGMASDSSTIGREYPLPAEDSRTPSAQLQRRQFLQGAGALIVSFAFAPLASALQNPPRAAQGAAPASASAATGGGDPDDEQLDSWIAIDAAGMVTLFSGKVELGTGVQTALSQIVAEELDVPVARVRVVQGETGRSPNQGITAGSKTLQIGGVQVRRAAAEARRALLELASAKLSAPVAALSVRDGIVHRGGAAGANGAASAARVSYAELIGGRTFSRTIVAAPAPGAVRGENAARPRSGPTVATADPVASTGASASSAGPAALKSPADYHIVGKPVPRVDLPAKIAGTHEYVHNVRLPGMLHARVVRPTAVGATLAAMDEASARALPGVVSIVRRANFVGIVAEREEQAIAAASALKITWTPPSTPLPDVDTMEAVIRATPVNERTLVDTGDRAAAEASAARRVEAVYSIPFQSHGSMGPSCAVADVRDGGATIWSGTQGSYALRDAIAALLELPADRVRVIFTEASGCYGHNGADDVAADAALLSREVGRPVRVQWSRADEHAWSPKGPAMLMEARGAVGANGEIVSWDYTVTTPTHLMRPNGRTPANLLAAQLLGRQPALGAGGGDRNARPSYELPNARSRVRWMQASVIRPSAFRGLGALANTFAIESFMDELAQAAGADPVQFRLRHLRDPRAIAVIQRVAEIAGWRPRRSTASASSGGAVPSGSPQPASPESGASGAVSSRPTGVNGAPTTAAHAAARASSAAGADIAEGRGFAFLQYENVNAYVATIVDVTVNRPTGLVRATRLFAAHDCGLIVNPDGLRNQIEGGLIQGLSRALKEQVRWDAQRVTTVDWQSYPILTFSEMPDSCEIALIDRPDQPALGAGEAAHCAAPAALANAIADATGVRLRAIPFTPDRVKAALAQRTSGSR